MQSKACSKCGVEKTVDQFHKHKIGVYGVHSWCKVCKSQRRAYYGDLNRERERKQGREHYHANKEKCLEANRQWKKNNPAKVAVIEKRSYLKTIESEKTRAKTRYAIRKGIIMKPSACQKCGTEGATQAHHHDYSKYLEVEFLCHVCHKAHHQGEKL
jgi:predicted Zn-ribbon and HTH transcriptional regulator